jgi:hypothetical protein
LGLKTVALGIALIVVLSVSIAATVNWWFSSVGAPSDFFVGVEFAYNEDAGDPEVLVKDLKALVDEVKDYTNLFVIGSIEISFNQTLLNEACDYVVDSGLHLIVFLTDSTEYHYANNYTVFDWGADAKQKYGDMFLGVYRYDEPGGHQLDSGPSILVENAANYTDMADKYSSYLNILLSYHKQYSDTVITADYGLYWFDYKAGYTSVLTEFGWNHSRPLHIGLCRGAAEAYNRDWGAIITWEYTYGQYIESPEELYEDMVLAYKNGAKYVVVFNYPKIGPYGILTDEHLDALKEFWSYIQSNPQEHGVIQGEVAYVLPKDYGFGFRYAEDKIWGLWEADELSQKVWDDVNTLLDQYGSRLDIVYDETEFMDAVKNRYDKLFFWNETIT